MIPLPKVEVRFDGSTWTDVTGWVSGPHGGISISRGRASEVDDPMSVGTCTFVLENDDGRFSPGLSSSPYYPYVVQGVAVRVSMWANGAYRPRFYGTVQSWTVSWPASVAERAIATVMASDSLGTLPSYTLRQAADEVVRSAAGVRFHWPLRDSSAPIVATIGAGTLTDNGNEGLGLGTVLLPMEEGADQHPLFNSASTGLTLTVLGLPGVADADPWRLRFILLAAPSATCDMVTMRGPSGALTLGWSSSTGLRCGPMTGMGSPSSYPAVVEVGSYDPPGNQSQMRFATADGTVTSANVNVGYIYRAPTKLTVNPTLSGGSAWSVGHLILMSGDSDATELGDFAAAILAPRISGTTPAPSQVLGFAGSEVTITGATTGATTLPPLEGRDLADVMGALATGTGARIRDDLDGTLTWIEFPPDGTPITLPEGEIDPGMTWGTSNLGQVSDVTVTWPDGTAYTATRPDGRRMSDSIEGVHATRLQDRTYADWLVHSSLAGARISSAPFSLLTLPEATVETLCSVTVGSRVTLTGLPDQMPDELTLIVEGLDEVITESTWTLDFKPSPDIYSRLGIYGTDTYDSGAIWAP